ncbi:HAD-IA family hydrolase [Brassicibacter mesophilus]|uniref:HAD-IA family hydrolase n=1 Tax=Brassicibacter mesophilus TaxID=745119 RepID=UPI003D23D188
MYEHIIWDFDGTLFNTYPVMTKSFIRALKDEGINESTERVMSLMKVSATHLIEYCQNKYEISEEFITRYNSYRKEDEKNHIKPFLDIEDICKRISLEKRNNYLFTHRGKSAIDFLKKFEIYGYFSDLITKENNFKRKPDPEAILYLIDKYHIRKHEALMIGDRDIDLLSAKNAGIDACFFSNQKVSDSKIADYTITNFIELLNIIGI